MVFAAGIGKSWKFQLPARSSMWKFFSKTASQPIPAVITVVTGKICLCKRVTLA
jgi:hypothetical protein